MRFAWIDPRRFSLVKRLSIGKRFFSLIKRLSIRKPSSSWMKRFSFRKRPAYELEAMPASEEQRSSVAPVSLEYAHTRPFRQCPRCRVFAVRRSRPAGWLEQLRVRFTHARPYRCRACGWRGWGQKHSLRVYGSTWPLEPAPLDLTALDEALRENRGATIDVSSIGSPTGRGIH
jgi:hypothetical protein